MADYYNTDVKIFWLYDQARNIYGSRQQALPINDGSRHKTQWIPYLAHDVSVELISTY